MRNELWQHTAAGDRYIVLLRGDVVEQAAGPLSDAQMAAVQADEWAIPWARGLATWVQARVWTWRWRSIRRCGL